MEKTNEEFENIDLGDGRLNKRVKIIYEKRTNNPLGTIPECSQDQKNMKATYRFFDNMNFEYSNLQKSHKKKTEERIKREKIVLAVQDTTSVDYTSLLETEGLGTLESKHAKGVFIHTTLAISENKQPLGIIEQKIWARETREEKGETRKNENIPIEEKETHVWIESLIRTNAVQKRNEEVKIINIGDRECDIYEYFQKAEEINQRVLIRARHNRKIEESEKRMIEYVESKKVEGSISLEIPKTKIREKRIAKLNVKYACVTIKPPKEKHNSKELKKLKVSIIIVEEELVDKEKIDYEPINWILITNMSVNNFAEACEKIKWYVCRWEIEVFHKTLKSGCNVEKRRFGNVENIIKYLALDSIVAWRILAITMAERVAEDKLCTEIFDEDEWKALYCYENKTREIPKEIPKLKSIKMSIAKLGGFLGRKGDGEPGITVMWRGLIKLNNIVEAWHAFGTNT